MLDTAVVSYQQTVLGLPVWQAALQVRMYGDPLVVASSDSTLHHDVRLAPPPAEELGRFVDEASSLHEALGMDDAAAQGLRVNDTRLLVYRYDPAERLDPTVSTDEPPSLQGGAPTLPLLDGGCSRPHPDDRDAPRP